MTSLPDCSAAEKFFNFALPRCSFSFETYYPTPTLWRSLDMLNGVWFVLVSKRKTLSPPSHCPPPPPAKLWVHRLKATLLLALVQAEVQEDRKVHFRTRSGMPTSSMDTLLRSCALFTTLLLSSFALLSAVLLGEVSSAGVGTESCSPTLLSEAGSGNEK